MHSAANKERPSSSSCCRSVPAGKSNVLERNNNNNDILLSTPFHSVLKQDSTHVFMQKKEPSKDLAKSDSLPPSGAARSVSKNSVIIVRTGNDVKEKTANHQDHGSVLSGVEVKSSASLTNAEPGRRVSSGVEMMSRFAPRPYRPASADSKVLRTRSQSVEVHALSGSRPGLGAGLDGQSSLRGRPGGMADDSRLGQIMRNSNPAADNIREVKKTDVAFSSSANNTSSNKLNADKGSSAHASSHSSVSVATSAGGTTTKHSKDVSAVNHLIQYTNSSSRGSQVKSDNLVTSNTKVPTMTTRNSVGSSPVPGLKSSNGTPSSAKSGGLITSRIAPAHHSHALPPPKANPQTVAAVTLKATASISLKATNDKKASSSASSAVSIPPNAASRSSIGTTTTTTVHSSPAVSCKESASVQTVKSSDVLLKGHPRDASLVQPGEGPTKPNASPNDRGSISSSNGGINSSVKHRAVIKSGPESLLFSNSCPGPVASQKLPKDSISTLGGGSVSLSKTATDDASVKKSVALEKNVNIATASSLSSSASNSAKLIGSSNSPSAIKSNNGETNCSPVSLSSPSTQSNSTTSSKSSLSSTTSMNCVANPTLTSPIPNSPPTQTSLSPNNCDFQRSSPESPVSPTDSMIVMDSPVAQPSDTQRKLNTPTGLRLSTKIDTSNDSVSSALSVLMKRQSASGNMVPASPKCSYRYGSRGAISSIYQNKLGSGASSQYNKNMSDLYGDFFRNMKDCRSLVKDANAPPQSQNDQISLLKNSFSAELESSKTVEIKPSTKDDSSLPASHSDQTSLNLYLCPTERRSRCNAPQPIRRVLSCDSASSPHARARSPLLASETRRLFFEGTSDATVKPDETQLNGIDRSPSPNTPYDPPLDAQTSFIDDPGADAASEAGVIATARATLKRSKSKRGQRVSFEPVSLLLNAALEGELDIVKVTIPKVRDAMVSNESGVTALHNSVFSGHHDVCRFLIDYGCTVNITDADGWTPLHCAGSCNNVEMVKLLVQNGACLFAMTFNDRQIPVEKCNRQLSGYEECRKYLTEQSQAIGVASGGVVYATVDYSATGTDELSFRETDQLRVIRKGDDAEMEWWWAKLVNQQNKQGYVPRNYLSMYPAKPKLTLKN